MELISPNGRILRKWEDAERSFEVDLSDYQNGIFLIRIFLEDVVLTRKVVKLKK